MNETTLPLISSITVLSLSFLYPPSSPAESAAELISSQSPASRSFILLLSDSAVHEVVRYLPQQQSPQRVDCMVVC